MSDPSSNHQFTGDDQRNQLFKNSQSKLNQFLDPEDANSGSPDGGFSEPQPYDDGENGSSNNEEQQIIGDEEMQNPEVAGVEEEAGNSASKGEHSESSGQEVEEDNDNGEPAVEENEGVEDEEMKKSAEEEPNQEPSNDSIHP